MKKTILLLFTILTLCFGIGVVSAKETYSYNYTGEMQILAPDKNVGTKNDKQCQALFGDPNKKASGKQDLAYYLQFALTVIKYLGIVLCIVLTITDFAKALLGEEKDMYKPLAKKAFQRLIYACCLFFLPYFVKVVLTLIGVYGTCGIG